MIKQLSNQKGVTLIELLLVVIIGAIVLILALSIQGFSLRSFNLGTSRAEIQQSARSIDEVLKNELRNAMEISSSDNDLPREVRLDLGENKLFYGENGDNYLAITGIESVNFEAEGEQALLFTINGGDYTYSKVIYLNNTSIPTDLNASVLYYELFDD